MPGSTIRLNINVRIPTYDALGCLLPTGNYVFRVNQVSSRNVRGIVNGVDFTFNTKQLLRMISNHQQVPVSPIRTTRLPPVASEVTSPLNDNSCPICLSTMTPQCRRHRLQCNHEFHRNCITRWLNMSRHCPVCRRRASITRPSPYRVTNAETARRRYTRRYNYNRNTSLPSLRD